MISASVAVAQEGEEKCQEERQVGPWRATTADPERCPMHDPSIKTWTEVEVQEEEAEST